MKRFLIIGLIMAFIPLTLIGQGSKQETAGAETMSGYENITAFTTLTDAQKQAESSPTVLFFHATWCPTCRTAMKDLESNSAELGNISVVVVDYDSNSDLKKQYGVTYQHTYVQIDERGEAVQKWNGGGYDEITARVAAEGDM